MSLQQTSPLPPNKIVDEREKGINTSSQKWLQQLTETAVENAFKLQAESGRLVGIVDTQSCGEPGGLGCSNPFSPLSSKLLKNSSSTTPLPSRNWALPKDSEDRCSVAAKIYALLVQWRSDLSFEWRARVLSALPVLEEALYQAANSKEDYTNQLLLDSQLKHVLCHFEAGNGLFLLQGVSPLYPVRACLPPTNCVSISNETIPIAQNAFGQDGSLAAESHEIIPDEIWEWGRANLPCTGDSGSGLHSGSCGKMEANCAQWDAVVSGQTMSMATDMHKHGGYASKKIVKTVINMLSKKRRDDNKQLKHELRRADHGAEKIARLFAKAEKKIASRVDVKDDGESCEPLQIKQEGPCKGDLRTRKRSGKTLGDMLRLNLVNGSDTGGSQVINVEEAPPILPMNEQSKSTVVCCLESDEMDPCCIFNSESMEVEMQSPLSFLSAGSEVAHNEDSIVSLTEEVLPRSVEAKLPTVQGLHEILACSSFPSSYSPSSSPTRSLSPSPPSASTSPWTSLPQKQLPLLSSPSPSPSPAAPMQHLAPPRSSTLPSPSLQHPPLTRSPPLQQLAPLTPSTSSSTPLHHFLTLSSSLPEQEQDQRQQAPTSSYMLQSQTLASCQAAEAEVQEPTTETGSQQTEAAFTSSPSANDDSSSQQRERGLRVPLGIFLAQRDDYNLDNRVPISSYESGPWDTWEEPTEQMDPLCCVCMVGLKGAAFIPCGHTFCRKCSRELWRGRGTCPLCNRYIREILDIY